MTTAHDALIDAFDRVAETVPQVVDGLSVQDLLHRPRPDANSIGWLIWHLARVEDDHLAGVAAVVEGSGTGTAGAGGTSQVWLADGWARRFGLPYPEDAIGYGQTSDEVGRFTISDPQLLIGYYAAVHQRTVEILKPLSDNDFDAIVDDSWDPPVTLATRVVSVVNDVTQHIGQAAYVKGLLG
ncbi:DinB family protein [Calidifontibacter sp. DB0510]|uniref:DinB family protein n=1 Tax=Metallococcus carri TaxID=1656884 RepID=A0A967EG63_9MICO|nr:DinB family protein [Metallococcus carri]NHN54678.1 DinB family protein [Metallococcus carri]NOP37023.1 DUF664 domain-containing protein [Calidifontibacter sp. DB2511S]